MASAIVMPRLSDTMTEGKIVKWHKKEGDPIRSGEAIADVETDKATLELESYEDGTLLKIVIPEGSSAPLGAPVAIIGEPGEEYVSLLAPAPAVPKEEAAPAEKPRVEAAPPIPSREVKPPAPQPPAPPPPPAAPARVKASPLARRLARASGIDLDRLAGSGPSGRIVAHDVEVAARRPPAAEAAVAPAGPPAPFFAFPEPPKEGLYELTGMRQIIAARTSQAWREAPHFFLSVDVDMEACSSLRAEMKSLGLQLSVNDFVLKAAAIGIRKVPEVNRSFEADHFRQHATIDLGMAVALPEGLVAPVLREADRLDLMQIAAAARDLSERARTKRLKPEEYAGGSVTVSNLGMFGVDSFYAVLNPPQSAILAVGRVAERPVVHGGVVVARRRMWLSLSGDHRAIDGALGARYLVAVKEVLERPVALMMA